MRQNASGRHRGRLAWYVIPMAVGLAAGSAVVAGGAYAWMSSTGSNTTSATIDGGFTFTTSAVVPSGQHLYAGGPKGALSITINPSEGPFRVTRIEQDPNRPVLVSNASGTCTDPLISIAPITVSISVNTSAVTRRINNAVTISPSSPNGCQGATFTIPVVLTGRSL
jgi:hypothetical protein